MVRSHIGNVVCRKALCVRVRILSATKTLNSKEFSVFLIFPLPREHLLVYH